MTGSENPNDAPESVITTSRPCFEEQPFGTDTLEEMRISNGGDRVAFDSGSLSYADKAAVSIGSNTPNIASYDVHGVKTASLGDGYNYLQGDPSMDVMLSDPTNTIHILKGLRVKEV